MKLKNIIESIALLACVAALNSCKSDDYELPEVPNANYVENAQQAFFSNTGVVTTIEITPDGNTFSIPVKRIGRDAATVSVTSTVLGDNPQNIQGGESITFAEGEAEGLLHYTYDPSAVELGHFDTLVVTIAPEFATAYGANSMTFLVGQSEPWVSLGIGYIADKFVAGGNYEVEIMQNGIDPRRFRVIKPYDNMAADAYADAVTASSKFAEYMELTIMQPGEQLAGVTLTQPNLVYFTPSETGYYYDDGEWAGTLYGAHTSDTPALYRNGYTEAAFTGCYVESYQEADAEGNALPAIINLEVVYCVSGFGPGWYPQADIIKITFPGVQVFDLTASITFDGVSTDFSGKNTYANVSVELGEDVAGADLYIFKWNDDGTNYYIDNAETGITSSGAYKVLFSEKPDGYYFFYVETYNEDETDGFGDYTDDYLFVDGELVLPDSEDEGEDEDEGGEAKLRKATKAAKATGHKLIDRAKLAKAIKAYKAKK